MFFYAAVIPTELFYFVDVNLLFISRLTMIEIYKKNTLGYMCVSVQQ